MLTWIQHLSLFEYCCNHGSAQGIVISPLLPSVFCVAVFLSLTASFFYFVFISICLTFTSLLELPMHFGAYQWQGNDRAWQTLSVSTKF
jgi:hypothetical protein